MFNSPAEGAGAITTTTTTMLRSPAEDRGAATTTTTTTTTTIFNSPVQGRGATTSMYSSPAEDPGATTTTTTTTTTTMYNIPAEDPGVRGACQRPLQSRLLGRHAGDLVLTEGEVPLVQPALVNGRAVHRALQVRRYAARQNIRYCWSA